MSVSVGVSEALGKIIDSLHLRRYTVHVCGEDLTVEVGYSAVEPAPLVVTVTVVRNGKDTPPHAQLDLRLMADSLGKTLLLAPFIYGHVRPQDGGVNGITFFLKHL